MSRCNAIYISLWVVISGLLMAPFIAFGAPLNPAAFATRYVAPGGVTITGLTVTHVAAGQIVSGSAQWASGTYYLDGTVAASTPVATLAAVTTGGAFSGTYSVTGAQASCFSISGSSLTWSASCLAGTSGTINVVATMPGATGSPYTVSSIGYYAGKTYYLSTSGNDGNAGTSGSPWATPNHSVNCGDTLQGASGTYSAFGTFGTVTCAGDDNVAWLKCATYGACLITSGTNSMYIVPNYWGANGWVMSGASNSCFKAAQVNTSTTDHHLVMANSVVYNCAGSGVQMGQAAGVGKGTDYDMLIGNVAYNNSSANGPCFSNFSFAGDSDTNNNAGTHRYVAYNVSYLALNGATCNGSDTTDGEGFIEDRPDINSVNGTLVVENNLFVGNGGAGLQLFSAANGTGTLQNVVRYNTLTGNAIDPHRSSPMVDLYLQGPSSGTPTYMAAYEVSNIAVSYRLSGNSITAYGLLQGGPLQSLTTIDADWAYGPSSQNLINYNNGYQCLTGSVGGSFPNSTACSQMKTGTDPVFAGAAYCTGAISGTTATFTSCSGAAVSNGMRPFAASGTQITNGTSLSGCTGSGTITCTASVSQTISSVAMVLLPMPGLPTFSSYSDTLTAMASFISAYRPTATSPVTATNYGAVNGSGGLKNASLSCDSYNSTNYIQNVERALPAIMDPCG